MVLFPKSAPAHSKESDDESAPKPVFLPVSILSLFGICLAALLCFAFQSGRFVELRVPLFLMEIQSGLIFSAVCFLFLAAMIAVMVQKAFITGNFERTLIGRSRLVSYFFSILTTLAFAVYMCAVAVYSLKSGMFLRESLFIAVLYVCVLIPHFKAGKTPLAHTFTTAAFIVVLNITAFYGGLATAKIERKPAIALNGETFLLCATQNNTYILSGFDPYRQKSNGKIMLLPKNAPALENMVFTPVGHLK